MLTCGFWFSRSPRPETLQLQQEPRRRCYGSVDPSRAGPVCSGSLSLAAPLSLLPALGLCRVSHFADPLGKPIPALPLCPPLHGSPCGPSPPLLPVACHLLGGVVVLCKPSCSSPTLSLYPSLSPYPPLVFPQRFLAPGQPDVSL